jgi:hypothetical protein
LSSASLGKSGYLITFTGRGDGVLCALVRDKSI